jgi:hypothetical protein
MLFVFVDQVSESVSKSPRYDGTMDGPLDGSKSKVISDESYHTGQLCNVTCLLVLCLEVVHSSSEEKDKQAKKEKLDQRANLANVQHLLK